MFGQALYRLSTRHIYDCQFYDTAKQKWEKKKRRTNELKGIFLFSFRGIVQSKKGRNSKLWSLWSHNFNITRKRKENRWWYRRPIIFIGFPFMPRKLAAWIMEDVIRSTNALAWKLYPYTLFYFCVLLLFRSIVGMADKSINISCNQFNVFCVWILIMLSLKNN